jgi:hypothetical protein
LTKDDLFLFTLEDLDTRLQLHRGEYDALTLAWLLRKLLLNRCGTRSRLKSGRITSRSGHGDPVEFGIPATTVGL